MGTVGRGFWTHHRLSPPFHRHSGCSSPFQQANCRTTGVKTGSINASQKDGIPTAGIRSMFALWAVDVASHLRNPLGCSKDSIVGLSWSSETGADDMHEKQAKILEPILGGEAWQKPSECWVVTVNRGDDAIVQFTDAAMAEYADDAALDADSPTKTIELSTDVDQQGNMVYRDPETESGCRWQQEAEHDASGLKSRTGDSYSVRRLE